MVWAKTPVAQDLSKIYLFDNSKLSFLLFIILNTYLDPVSTFYSIHYQAQKTRVEFSDHWENFNEIFFKILHTWLPPAY